MDINRTYKKYEGLALVYAKKLFSYERIGFEREDVIQELKIKIFTSLLAYQRKWDEYQNTGRCKPIPIPYYLRTAMINKIKDFATNIAKSSWLTHVEECQIDMGYSHEFTKIDFKGKEIIVRDVDLLTGLADTEKSIFCLYLKGYNANYIQRLFKKKKVKEIIDKQVGRLGIYKNELISDRRKYVINHSYSDN